VTKEETPDGEPTAILVRRRQRRAAEPLIWLFPRSVLYMRMTTTVVTSLMIAFSLNSLATGEPKGKESQRIEWLTHYGSARRASDKSERPVMLFLTTEGCLHCTRMQHDAFRDKRVINDVKKSFVPAMIKIQGESRLANDLRVTVYPTTVFIAPDGKILDYIRGYIPTDNLRYRMNRVVDASAASVASRSMP
jgi:thioredoxin-related protein